MRSRSPSCRTTPPPPHISRRSPGGFSMRGKSPERRRRMVPPPGIGKFVPVAGRSGSPPRSREHRRDFRHSPRRDSYGYEQMTDLRRSRSPLHRESKVRSYSPGKRKMSPPKRERERVRSRDPDGERMRSRESDRERRPPRPDLPPPRKRTRSKSAEGGDRSRMGSYPGPMDVSPPRTYQGPPGPYPQGGPPGADRDEPTRLTMSERFYASGSQGFKKESDNPVFRGPEGSGFDINELKKITIDVRRNIPAGMDSIERNIIKPEDVVLVRRPGEGSRPIFEKIMQESRLSTGAVEEHRVVAILNEAPPIESQGSLRRADERDNGDYPRATSSRFESPGRYSDPRPRSRSRDGYYPPLSERDAPPRSSRDYERGHGPGPGFQPRERSREDAFDRHSDDLRHELDLRRRDENRYPSQESRRYDYRPAESGRSPSDLRMRINEKRTDHHDDRDHRTMEPHYPERDRPHRGMMQPSPPGSDRRRGPGEEFGHPMDGGRMHGSGVGRMHHSSGNRQGPPDRFHYEPPSERFHYKSWDSNPEHVPKGRAYFEQHDNRGDEGFVPRGRGRGMLRGNMMRGRGMVRGRPFRGAGAPVRFFMGRSGSRRGYSPRKPTRRSSPHWEHDLFDDVERPNNK
ncbi:hypothetical protein L9F63_013022 [Diploptera punctata]|uniref:Complementary sex determination N-terminal domain-containing protein n=1 Tax=Diploptera punctata TaxID=6984 RepID=A0AAD8AD70_DIPPU|nr:hypothetical protein L9F63_013022 [Diploptera punctata]